MFATPVAPVPASETVCDGPPLSSFRIMVAERGPRSLGVNRTLMIRESFAFRVNGVLELVTRKSPALIPASSIPVTLIGLALVFEIVTGTGLLLVFSV
jgi:hypothetical protein